MKTCKECGKLKDESEFYGNKLTKDGLIDKCKDCTKSIRKQYCKDNVQKLRASRKKYYQKNKEKIIQKSIEWTRKNPDRKRAINKRSKKNNREYERIYAKNYIRANPKLKLSLNISRVIRLSLKGNKNGQRWETILGYTLADLQGHLEKQFIIGMAWKNYGEWHLEHRIPVSVHNFTSYTDIDFKKCWALDNLQPMWAMDNLKKGSKLEESFQPSLAI